MGTEVIALGMSFLASVFAFGVFMWRVFVKMFEQFGARIDQQFVRIDDRFESLDRKMDDRFETLDRRIDEKIQPIEAKVDSSTGRSTSWPRTTGPWHANSPSSGARCEAVLAS